MRPSYCCEIAQNSLRVNMKNVLGEYYSFFKQMTWNYDLHLNWINFYRNDR